MSELDHRRETFQRVTIVILGLVFILGFNSVTFIGLNPFCSSEEKNIVEDPSPNLTKASGILQNFKVKCQLGGDTYHHSYQCQILAGEASLESGSDFFIQDCELTHDLPMKYISNPQFYTNFQLACQISENLTQYPYKCAVDSLNNSMTSQNSQGEYIIISEEQQKPTTNSPVIATENNSAHYVISSEVNQVPEILQMTPQLQIETNTLQMIQVNITPPLDTTSQSLQVESGGAGAVPPSQTTSEFSGEMTGIEEPPIMIKDKLPQSDLEEIMQQTKKADMFCKMCMAYHEATTLVWFTNEEHGCGKFKSVTCEIFICNQLNIIDSLEYFTIDNKPLIATQHNSGAAKLMMSEPLYFKVKRKDNGAFLCKNDDTTT